MAFITSQSKQTGGESPQTFIHSMQTVIKEYIRDINNNPRGVAVAVKDNNEVHYGFSLCNPKDRYNKTLGMKIAMARALSEIGYNLPVDPSTRKSILARYKSLERRALAYFQDVPAENVRNILEDDFDQ